MVPVSTRTTLPVALAVRGGTRPPEEFRIRVRLPSTRAGHVCSDSLGQGTILNTRPRERRLVWISTLCGSTALADDREDAPRLGDAVEVVFTAIFEPKL